MSKATPNVPPPTIELDTSTPMERFLEAHFKKLVLIFAAAIVGALLYGVVSYTSKLKAEAAGAAFAAAKTVEDCDLVISEYPGSLAAGNALLLKADLLWTENKKDSSVAALREFTTKHSGHPLLAETLLGLGTKLESMGEAGEARTTFERVTKEFASNDVAALAQLRLGDLLWAAGNEAEAKAAYEAVPVKFASADPDFIEQSANRLSWIAAKLPTTEVDGPPKPKVDPSAPIPGAPQLKLDSTLLNPAMRPAGIQVSPGAPVAPKIEVTPVPAPAAPAPQMEVKPAPAPAPATPAVEVKPVPAPAPAAPTEPKPVVPAPPVEAKPAPAPATPVTPQPQIEVKPAPAVPTPVAPPAPAPVPAPAAPAAPAPDAPAKAS